MMMVQLIKMLSKGLHIYIFDYTYDNIYKYVFYECFLAPCDAIGYLSKLMAMAITMFQDPS